MSHQGNNYFCRGCGRKHHNSNFMGFSLRYEAEKLRLCKGCYLNSIEPEEEMGDMMLL